MNIRISPSYGPDPYQAVDDDTYDGAEDSSNRFMIGYGATPEAATQDLLRLMQEMHEYNESKEPKP